MHPENVLLIGGNGFLGSHTAAAFQQLGCTVSVLDVPGSARTLNEGAPVDLTQLQQFAGSIVDPSDVDAAIESARADTVVIFASYGEAGLGLVKSGERNPRGAVAVNIEGLLNVLDAIAKRGKGRLVWLSSTTVYGPASGYVEAAVDETSHVSPGSVYAATKTLGEQLIRTYRATHGVDAVAVRPTLVWGPGITYTGVQSGLNAMVEAAERGQEAEIAGSDEPWDLLYVKDAGAGVAAIAQNPPAEDVVLLNGYVASLRDVHDAVRAAVPNAQVRLTGGAPRLGFPPVNDARIRAHFTPRYDLDASIADFMAVLRDERNPE